MTTTATLDQAWLDQQVKAAANDIEPGIYTQMQAGRHPKTLIKRWRQLNQVIGAETADTYLGAAGVGLAVSIVVALLLTWAGWSRMGGSAAAAGVTVGLILGSIVAYARFINMVFLETYIEVIVTEYHSAISAVSEVTDVASCFMLRLAWLNRPEVLEGNQGNTGFRDRGARIRLRTHFGQSIADLRDSRDYLTLLPDPSDMVPAPAILRYAIIALVREAGRLYKDYGVPEVAPNFSSKLVEHWPYIFGALGLLGAVLVNAL